MPARPKTSEGSTRASAPQMPRWSTSPVKSSSPYTSSIGSPRYKLTSSGKGLTQTSKKEERVGSGTSTPRKNSDEARENGKIDSKTRKNSLHDYSHIKSKISTCWEKSGTREVGGKTDTLSLSSADSSPASVRRGAGGNEAKLSNSRGVGHRVDYSHVTARTDSHRSGSVEGARAKVTKRAGNDHVSIFK